MPGIMGKNGNVQLPFLVRHKELIGLKAVWAEWPARDQIRRVPAGTLGSDAMGRPARREHHRRRKQRWCSPMPRPNDSHRSLLPLEQESTLIAVVELSHSSWLVAGIVPGLERHPLKKL